MKNIAVIGLGYVGLPLALLAEEKGFSVIGIDANNTKIKKLQQKISLIDDVRVAEAIKNTNIVFSSDFSLLSKVEIAVVCVPTPVDENKMPDTSIVREASLSAAKNLKNGSLLIVESTINPGVCDEIIIPTIEEFTDHKIGKTLHIAHCPERINPGDPKWHVGNINRVLGANSTKAADMAYEFYGSLIDAKIKKMGSIKEAEAVKIVENSFRDINIAFVNELAMSFEKLGINVVNVIDGAATKPFAFIPHYPSIGVGGHCIPVDPYYLIEYARGNGFEHHFLSLARSINEGMPIYAIDTVEKILIEKGMGDLFGKKVAILGLSYKANVADRRESPSTQVISTLVARGSVVSVYDPYFPEESTHLTLAELLSSDQDVVILAVAHDAFLEVSVQDLAGVKVFLDGKNALTKLRNELTNSPITYLGIGTS